MPDHEQWLIVASIAIGIAMERGFPGKGLVPWWIWGLFGCFATYMSAIAS